MPTHELIGLVLVAVGVSEPLVGMWIAARQSNPANAAILRISMIASGLLMIGLGAAFYTQLIPLG